MLLRCILMTQRQELKAKTEELKGKPCKVFEKFIANIFNSQGVTHCFKSNLWSLNCMWSSIVLELWKLCLLIHLFVFGFGLKPSKSTESCQGKPLDTLSPWISRCQDTSRPGNLLEQTWMLWMEVETAWKACERPFCAFKVWRPCLLISSAVRNDPRTSSGIRCALHSEDLQGKMSSWKMPSTVSEKYESSGTFLLKLQFYNGFVYRPRGFAMLHPSPKSSGILHCSDLNYGNSTISRKGLMCSSHPRFSAGSGSAEETGAAGSGETSEARVPPCPTLALSKFFVSFEAQKRDEKGLRHGILWVYCGYCIRIIRLPIAWSYFESLRGNVCRVLCCVSFWEGTGASAPLTPLFAGKAISETQTRSTSEKAKNLRHAPFILVPSWVRLETWTPL